MDSDFYRKYDFKYPEIGICMENTTGPTVKIFIPIATPTLSNADTYDNKDMFLKTSNIVSDMTSINIEACTTSNYITMRLPSDIESLDKGDQVIIVFIGGDINKPAILRRYEQ